MDLKAIATLLLFALFVIPVCNATMVTDSITLDGTYWTVPANVYSINLTLYPGGGSGLGGLYVYKSGDFSIYMKANGPGGLKGTPSTYSNIPVTPGTSIQIHIGQPGAGPVGYLGVCPATGTSTFNVPATSYTGYDGGTSYVIINGVTYSSTGGSCGRVKVTCTSGVPTIQAGDVNNYNINGETGYLTSSTFAQSGSATQPPYGSGAYSYGGAGGQGYSAGGGGGGMGWTNNDPTGGAGSGGVGAPGIVQISYESSTAQPYAPSGYVTNYTGTAISGATVTITQLLNTVSTTTDGSGHYSIAASSNFIANVVVNMTISKTGYTTDINNFVPLTVNTVVNRTLIESGKICSPPCIYGLTTQYWTNSTVPQAEVYLRVNGTSTIQATTTSNAGAYYIFNSGIIPGTVYDVWDQKTGYGNSSVRSVMAVGV